MSSKSYFKNGLVIGGGYVGLSIACLLASKMHIRLYDIDLNKVKKINAGESPIEDRLISEYLKKNVNLSLFAVNDLKKGINNADLIIIALPTSFSEIKKGFNTDLISQTIKNISKHNFNGLIVIKSTVPIGYTQSLQSIYETKNIIFSPEFLREGQALQDNLYPSRIIVGNESKYSKEFSILLKECSLKKKNHVSLLKSSEAEAAKLFSNSYLAMRVAFFNELDSFSLKNQLSSKNIIDAVSLDPRIGKGYNNPSFGFGGYCLPKDTKQLKFDFNIPQSLISATIKSNDQRTSILANHILRAHPKSLGIYKLAMKKGSDNYRSSAILSLIKKLKESAIKIYIYEPSIQSKSFMGCKIIKDVDQFKDLSEKIIANRLEEDLLNVKEKIFTRDVYNSD